KQDTRSLLENKSKLILINCSLNYKYLLQEVLQDLTIQSQLANTKFTRYLMITLTELKSYKKSRRKGAIGMLFLSDELFRSADIPTCKKYLTLVKSVYSIRAYNIKFFVP
ncbi:17672_t:CDS:2, partial [Gigaspora margarita]